MSSQKSYKIIIHCLDATGHLNATIGIAQALAKRGHEVIYVIFETVQTRLEKLGFRVIPLTIAPENRLTKSDNPAKEYAEKMEKAGFFEYQTSQSKIQKLNENPTMFTMLSKQCVDFHPQILRALETEKPDLVLTDQLFYPPALAAYPVPWVALMSVQPNSLFRQKDSYPPPLSGFAQDKIERAKWDEFQATIERTIQKHSIEFQDKLNAEVGFVPTGSEYTPNLFYMFSPTLNIYQYPRELEAGYEDKFESSPHPFTSIDACVREEPQEDLQLPAEFQPASDRKLIYLSMGSMGGFDTNLMKRLVGILAKLPYKVIVAKGPLGDGFELADNMWGRNSLPQTSIIPLVDLVITHGGNNTVCETFFNGKPMIIFPLYGDQYDNAQRLEETGYGARLEPYNFRDEELVDAVNRLINDQALKERLEKAKKRMQSEDRKNILVTKLEQVIQKSKMK